MKQKFHTHYDNLKVARNAPPEVIRAAYRILSQKFHPDRNPDNPDAARIMAILNTSYEELSDPVKRREHDKWIVQQEMMAGKSEDLDRESRENSQTTSAKTPSHQSASSGGFFSHFIKNWILYAIVAVIYGFISFFSLLGGADKPSTPVPSGKPYQTAPAPVRQEYVRPNTAPNGQPWPVTAGYVDGYQRLHMDGLSAVIVDNSRNDSDVFVKLNFLNGAQAYPVRQFYIPAFGSFTLDRVTAGVYDIRYRDLNNGGLSRSEAFSLVETPTYNGTQYSNLTVTLYKVQNGNMQTYNISESEF